MDNSTHQRGDSVPKHINPISSTDLDHGDEQKPISGHPSKAETRAWKETLIRLGPLGGLFCMVLAIASIIAALGVLLGSRNQATTRWSVPPSTYLAICTAVANQALRFAAYQGVVIAWWFGALSGNNLAELHHKWHAGMTVGGALRAGRYMGLVGLAALFSTLVAVDGPLLQKATTIISTPINEPYITLNVTMAQELPSDIYGFWTNKSKQFGPIGPWSPSFNKTIPNVNGSTSNNIIPAWGTKHAAGYDWFKPPEVTIPDVVRGCPGTNTCKALVKAPALVVTSCVSHVIPVDYWQPVDLTNVVAITGTAPPLKTLAFLVDVSLELHGKQTINLITGYGRSQNCSGTFNYTVCSLESAIGEYEVFVKQDRLTLAPGLPRIIDIANNTQINTTLVRGNEWYTSSLAGVVGISSDKYKGAINFFYDSTVDAVDTTGYGGVQSRSFFDPDSTNERCVSFTDPLPSVLEDMDKLMFLLGRGAAIGEQGDDSLIYANMDPGLPIKTTTKGYIHGVHNTFKTNLNWFGATVVVELVCVVLILPTYFGWWRLGRPVSFSPLELAKAFEAPLLRDCNSNSSGKDLAKTVGDVRVRYAVIREEDSHHQGHLDGTKLAFTDSEGPEYPQQNSRFQI